MPLNPLAKVTRDGKTVDRLTDAALQAAERKLGYSLTITQGSYNAGGVSASAGTHDGGGVVDLMPWDWERKVKALRAVGFAAWYRPAIPGLWPAHLHAVLIGHPKLAPSAQRQVAAYFGRHNGLADNGPDTDPGWVPNARFDWDGYLADLALRTELDQAKRAANKAGRESITAAIKRLRSRLPKR